ncbi:MAG: glycosyltransferase [Lactobacillales bacterium]|nr:glycosyltransferase [Lactobacillales bacterium]
MKGIVPPKISIIVPVYNVEEYLGSCLDSIINQTYSNLEIIVVNDGSTDNSLEIAKEYMKRDDRIKIIEKKNGGLASARNAGLDEVTGDFIGFVDSDDWINEDMYKKLLTNALKENAELSIVSFYRDFGNGVRKTENIPNQYLVFDSADGFKYVNIHGYFGIVVWDKLFKSNIFENIRFEVGEIGEDYPIIYHAIDKASKIVYDSEPLYYYRLRANSISHSQFSLFPLKSIHKMLDLVKEKYSKVTIFAEYGYTRGLVAAVTQLSFLEKNNDVFRKNIRKMASDNIKKNYKKYSKIIRIPFVRKMQIILIGWFPIFYYPLLNLGYKMRNSKLFNFRT